MSPRCHKVSSRCHGGVTGVSRGVTEVSRGVTEVSQVSHAVTVASTCRSVDTSRLGLASLASVCLRDARALPRLRLRPPEQSSPWAPPQLLLASAQPRLHFASAPHWPILASAPPQLLTSLPLRCACRRAQAMMCKGSESTSRMRRIRRSSDACALGAPASQSFPPTRRRRAAGHYHAPGLNGFRAIR